MTSWVVREEEEEETTANEKTAKWAKTSRSHSRIHKYTFTWAFCNISRMNLASERMKKKYKMRTNDITKSQQRLSWGRSVLILLCDFICRLAARKFFDNFQFWLQLLKLIIYNLNWPKKISDKENFSFVQHEIAKVSTFFGHVYNLCVLN